MHYIQSSNMGIDENGNPCFVDGPPGTKVNAAILNALVREVTNVIVQSGLTVLTKDTDTYTQLWESLQVLGRPYDLIVSSQITFNSMIERVAANHYQIKSQYKSIFVKGVTGGYNTTTWLSGGDTWGYLDTNQCTQFDFEAGAYIACGDSLFYLNSNTDDAVLNNVYIKGDNVVAVACTCSFRHWGYRVTYNNCKTSHRFSTTNFEGFTGNDARTADTERVSTTKYYGCMAYSLKSNGGTVKAFVYCYNMHASYAYTIDSSAGEVNGYYYCREAVACHAFDFDTTGAFSAKGFSYCYRLNNCYSEYITSLNSVAIGFANCEDIGSSRAFQITSGENCYGAYQCSRIAGCYFYDLESTGSGGSSCYGMRECNCVSSCEIKKLDLTGGAGSVYGLYSCNNISGVSISDLDNVGGQTVGIYQANSISACELTALTSGGISSLIGMQSCKVINSCYIHDITNTKATYGFNSCVGVSNCTIYNVVSTGDSAVGFDSCQNLSSCISDSVKHTGAIASKNAYGFNGCSYIAACYTTGTTTNGAGGANEGFHSCSYIAATAPSEAANTLNNYINTDDATPAKKVSTPDSVDNKWT